MTNQEEVKKQEELQKVVNELFNLANASYIGRHLSETITALVQLDTDSEDLIINGEYLSKRVHLQISLINFFHNLEKANLIKS